MATARTIAAGLLGALALAGGGCGASGVSAYDPLNSYMDALASGSYTSACALLDRRTRESLVRSVGTRSCARAFARCLPNQATKLRRDHTQLLYANIQMHVSGSRASASVSRTAVAAVLRRVTLALEGGRWRLTSPGAALETCSRRQGRR